ncbi:MAG: Ig-like domain-containing protein [Dokdonella sp.]|uniref:cadherin-like domain-containing protein n=1 Tax=Dokdonella sp. TaxID=2291710 RepID=UPI003F81414B
MRRRLIPLLALACTAIASAQILPKDPDDDGVPSVTDASVPLSYVGNDGSVSIGVNREGHTEGQLLGVFARNNARAMVGQIWWDQSGAGGAQADFNWLWGGDPIAAREHPDRATVARLSFAVDQNGEHDRKATLGFGIERRAFSVEGWLSHGISGARLAGHAVHSDVATTSGDDDIGTYTQVDTTTIQTLFERKPYGAEIGLQVSHVFEPLAMRVHAGASTQDGDGARASTFAFGLDTPLGTRGWGLSALAEHVARSGGAGEGDDDRLSVFLRYEFGRHGAFVPTAQLEDPAWIARSLARASSAHPRTVESYRRTRTETVEVTHGPRQYTNHFPVAQADAATTTVGVPVSLDVVANDSDADGDALAVIGVTAPAHGSAAASGNTILYTPAAGFSGVDTFAYTLSDGRGGHASANVTVTIGGRPNRAPVARDDRATTSFGQPVTIAVLANDDDADGDALVLAGVGAPAHGSASIVGSDVVYRPVPGFSGVDTFTYTVDDGRGGSATATITVVVAAQPNRLPIARDDAATAISAQPVLVDALANDSDADGDVLSLASVGAPQHGSATIIGTQLQYASVAGYVGADVFTYTISDGRGGSSTARVTLNVVAPPNRPPVAVDDVASTTFGVAVPIAVLANDSDPDGDPLTITATTAPAFGTIAVSGGTITYTPTVAGVVGVDRFTYTISDGRGGGASATVAVTVGAAPNQPPVAVDDTAATPFGVPVTVAVLANDSDPDGDPLVIASVGAPLDGTAAIAGNTVVYTPAAGFSGVDRFSYTIGDGRGGSATAFVTVVVAPAPNQPPVAVDDTGNLNQTVIAVLANDSDPDGDPLTIIAVTQPIAAAGGPAGTVAITGNTVTWAPNGFLGAATFTYTISDGRGGTATATVNVATGIP